jgi:hypothetical protein
MVGLGLRLLRLRRKQSTFISRMRAWWVIRVEQSAGESFRADKQWPFGEGQVACQQQRATLVPLTELDRFVADCAQLQGVFDGKTRLGTGHVGREPFPSPSASPPCGRTRPAFCVARCPRLDNRLTMLNVMVVLARRGISRSTAGCIVARNARERDIHPSPLQRTGPIPCGRDARSAWSQVTSIFTARQDLLTGTRLSSPTSPTRPATPYSTERYAKGCRCSLSNRLSLVSYPSSAFSRQCE